MAWYYAKCEAAGIAHHGRVKPHSFRIGGATALFAAGVTAEEIQAMGRWFSDVYCIYCRLSKKQLLNLSSRMRNPKSTQFLDGQAGFIHTGLNPALQQALGSNLLDVEPAKQVAPDEASSQAAEEAELADDDSDFGVEADDRDDSGGSDAEFLAAIAKGPRPGAEPELPSIESLFELDYGDMAIWHVSDGV